MNILLDIPALEARKLITLKNKRDYTDKEADLQEEDTDYLSGVRAVYLQLAENSDNWQIVEVMQNDQLRSIDEISDTLFQLLQQHLKLG